MWVVWFIKIGILHYVHSKNKNNLHISEKSSKFANFSLNNEPNDTINGTNGIKHNSILMTACKRSFVPLRTSLQTDFWLHSNRKTRYRWSPS